MNGDLIYPQKYLKGADIVGKGKDVTLTICEAVEEEIVKVGGNKELTICLYFDEIRERSQREGISPRNEKRYIVTNPVYKVLRQMFTNETDNWIGKPVTMYTERGNWGGDIRDAIRVRLIRPEGELP